MSVIIENEIFPFLSYLPRDYNVVLYIYIFKCRLIVDEERNEGNAYCSFINC